MARNEEKKPEVIIDDCWRKLALAYIDMECTTRDMDMDDAGKAEIIDMLENLGVKDAALKAVQAPIAMGFVLTVDVADDDDEADEDEDEDEDEDDSDDGEPVAEEPRRRARG